MRIRNVIFAFVVCLAPLLSLLSGCGAGSQPPVTQSQAVTQPPEPTTVVPTMPDVLETPTTQQGLEDQTMAISAVDVRSGRHLYGQICAPCHGLIATGIDGIGVDLTRSTFVAGLTPLQLADFLIRGLSINNPFNVTDIKMPPKGGHDELTDQELLDVAAYLQSINTAPRDVEIPRVVDYLTWVEAGGADDIEATPEIGKEGLSGKALDGQTLYLQFCAVCHGPNGEGVESLGKGFRGSTFIADLSDKELAEFLSQGRPDDHPLNETGVEMLPYGGQPYLTNEELDAMVAYIRAVNTEELIVPLSVEEQAALHQTATAETKVATPLPTATPLNELDKQAIDIIEHVSPRCYACHYIGGNGNQGGPGPNLNGLHERAGTRRDGYTAEDYVRQSILDPGAFIVDECPRGPCVDVMVKNYAEKLSDKQLDILIPYLLSLSAE